MAFYLFIDAFLTWILKFPHRKRNFFLIDAFNNIQRLEFHAAKFPARKKQKSARVRAHCKASETRFALAAATKLHCLSP